MADSLITRVDAIPSGREDPFREEVAVELAAGLVDQDAEKDVAGVAIAPLGAGGEVRGQLHGDLDQLVLGVVLPVVEVGLALPVLDPRGVGQEVPHRDALPPGGGRSGST
jgi:hypothetical protein